MTIGMADKLVTTIASDLPKKIRKKKKKERKKGLNSVFTNVIICRLTETTISKSRDVWRQSRESVPLLSWIQLKQWLQSV